MANKVIGGYTAAVTIDGATHFMLIQPGSAATAYNKISRNVLLGVTGQPMDISSSQNVTNKTLDNTNTITLKDTLFTLQDDGDATKQARFQLSGITTATTRTYTLPNASSTLADISTAQTFTNKTITGPTITGGSITGTTITTDAIVGQSSATNGTIYGLSISSSKVGTNGVITASITDAAVTPAKLVAGTGSTWAWASWTPSFSNWTIGTGGSAGTITRYVQTGKTVSWWIMSTLGTSGQSVGSSATFTLPVAPSATYLANTPIGFLKDSNNDTGQIWFSTGSTATLIFQSSSGAYTQAVTTTNLIPFTWAAGSNFTASGTYQVD